MSLLKALLQLPYQILLSMYAILETFFPFLPSPYPRITQGTHADQLQLFTKSYEEKYSKRHPPFYPHRYRQLINEMKQQLYFSMIYLHSEQHEQTTNFCRETLSHPQLIQFLQSKQIRFYIGPMHLQESYDVASLLNVAAFPFIALFSVTNVQGATKPIEIFRSEGFVPPEKLIESLRVAIEKNESVVTPLRVERSQLESERRIREMQDQAYLASLKHDQEKKRKLDEDKLAEQQKREAEERKKLEMVELIQSRILRRKLLRPSFPADPTHLTPAVPIQFKFPDGTRTKRMFALSDTIRQMYQYVDTLDPNQEDTLDTEGVQRKAEALLCMLEDDLLHDIETKFGFFLISMYPRKKLELLDCTVEEVLGTQGASIAVETI